MSNVRTKNMAIDPIPPHAFINWLPFWGNQYPAVQMGKQGSEMPLPGEATWLTKETVRTSKCVLLLGERRAGTTSVLEWWRKEAESVGFDSIMVPIDAEAESVLNMLTDSHRRKAQKRIKEKHDVLCIVRFREEAGAAKHHQAMSARLRSAWETHPHGSDSNLTIRLLVASSSLHQVADTLESSGLISIADVYRLPSLQSDVIEAAARARFNKGQNDSIEENFWTCGASNKLIAATGGQPFLTSYMLDLCDQIRRDQNNLNAEKVIEAAVCATSRTPPSSVQVWQEHLALLFQRQPERKLIMERYAEGMTQKLAPPLLVPSAVERELFVAGWVGERSIGNERRWGIRSDLHRAWARPVLWQARSER